MASPIAGNESFTTVENSVGQIDRLNVADVNAFDLVTQNLLIEDNARISSLKPSLEGLNSTAETANEAASPITLTGVNNLVLSDFNGGAATVVNLPAATENATVVLLFTTGNTGVNTLTISCASGEVFLAGTTLKTAGVTVAQSVADNNTLVYTPGTTTANLLDMSTRLYFICTNAGVWRMNSKFNCTDTTTTGAFVFSTV